MLLAATITTALAAHLWSRRTVQRALIPDRSRGMMRVEHGGRG